MHAFAWMATVSLITRRREASTRSDDNGGGDDVHYSHSSVRSIGASPLNSWQYKVHSLRELPDMMSAWERVSGVMEKQTYLGRLHEFDNINQIQMQIGGEGVKKSENFADITSGSSLTRSLALFVLRKERARRRARTFWLATRSRLRRRRRGVTLTGDNNGCCQIGIRGT